MQSMRLPLSIALAALLHASAAHAFTEPLTFADNPALGGGGDRFFTARVASGRSPSPACLTAAMSRARPTSW
jgi:hypothetical protein